MGGNNRREPPPGTSGIEYKYSPNTKQYKYPPNTNQYPPNTNQYQYPGAYQFPDANPPKQKQRLKSNRSPANNNTQVTRNAPAQRSNDLEAPAEETFAFDSIQVRHAFIQKVYMILSAQLFVTFAIICMFVFIDKLKYYAKQNYFLFYLALIMVLILSIALSCFEAARRQFPLNFILLSLFTIFQGIALGFVSMLSKKEYVLYSAAITMVIVVSLTLFAFQTKIDFTVYSGGALIVLILMLGLGIMMYFMQSKILYVIYCCLGVAVFAFYIVIDTQMMISDKYHYSISPEDYIFASLNLYIDVINIYVYILSIMDTLS